MSSDKIISKIEKLSPLERHTIISKFFSEYPCGENVKIFCCFYCGKLGSFIKNDSYYHWYNSHFIIKNEREVCRGCLAKNTEKKTL